MTKWNEGLILDIDELDNDHKKILSIIDELSICIKEEEPDSVLTDVFEKLEETAKNHFKKEEKYLGLYNIESQQEHKEKHREFLYNISSIKKDIINSNSIIDSQEKCFYLTDWFLKHIVQDDVPAINNYKHKDTGKKNIKQKIINTTTKKFSFTRKIFFLSIIPLFGMLILGTGLIWNNYTRYQEIKNTSYITHIISNINELAHVFQIERGLSAAYISSSKRKFKDNLIKQRKIVDSSIDSFNKKLLSVQNNELLNVRHFLNVYRDDVYNLKEFRSRIDNENISQKEIINFYTDIIKNILSITSKIATVNLDKDISSSVSALSSLLHSKETLGLKRAYGAMIIERQKEALKEYIKFLQLSGAQNALLENFNQTASPKQKEQLDRLIHSNLHNKITNFEDNIKNHNFKNIDSLIWFETMTELIDKMKVFEEELLLEINVLIDESLDKNMRTLYMWIICTIIIFIVTTIVIYIFEESSRNEIYQFVEAMNHLAKGGRSLKLETANKNEEMTKMYKAYETTRQKLLEGDIYMQLYLQKKELEIQKHEKRNKELKDMAFKDSLTQTINRRKFEEISIIELNRSIRYDRELSFLMLDIDHFKAINDNYGHAIGDEVLKHFSQISLKMARSMDAIARIGGEEFVIMLPETSTEDAYTFAERFREKISSSTLKINNHEINYSVSIGVSSLDKKQDKNVKSILHRADEALYEAKKAGRNNTKIC